MNKKRRETVTLPVGKKPPKLPPNMRLTDYADVAVGEDGESERTQI